MAVKKKSDSDAELQGTDPPIESPAPTETKTDEAKASESKTEEPKEDPAAPDGRRTPEGWAKKLGKLGKAPGIEINKKPVPAAFSWDHAAADQIHGWSMHGQHSAEAFVLTQGDYEAALLAAAKPDPSGNYLPHSGALSPFKRG